MYYFSKYITFIYYNICYIILAALCITFPNISKTKSAILHHNFSHNIISKPGMYHKRTCPQASFQCVYFTNHSEQKSVPPSRVMIISGEVWENIIRQTL